MRRCAGLVAPVALLVLSVSACNQPSAECAGSSLACRSFTSTSGTARGEKTSWLTSTPLHLSFDAPGGPGGPLVMVVKMPCGVLNAPVAVDDSRLVPAPLRMAESANGCASPESDQRSWTTAFFKVPSVYRFDSSELVLTNEFGQIRFKQD